MFETAELGRKVSKSDYRRRTRALWPRLVQMQRRLRAAKVPVIVLFAGVDGAGKSETVNLLNGWLDPRWTVTRAYGEATEDERDRPPHWRFWRDLPAAGQLGFLLSAWYSQPLLDRVYGGSHGDFDMRLDEIRLLERTLADQGAILVKFWMHLDKGRQKERLEALEADPLQSWRVTARDWEHWRLYEQFVPAAEHLIMRTSTGVAPWFIIEGTDERYRTLAVADKLLETVNRHLDDDGVPPVADAPSVVPDWAREEWEKLQAGEAPPAAEDRPLTILSTLDMASSLANGDYREQLELYTARLGHLQRRAVEERVSTIVVFEGVDAAGKGGAIRRLTGAMDARSYQVIPIAAPSDEERAHHYLWRFWRHLPRAGRVTIFDRSWYGRVLVERVEGFASERDWRHAHSEINLFEQQLLEHGVVLVKLWIHIDRDEQLRRFISRAETAHKTWKLTEEDWRNRERWNDYELAVHDMVERTSTYHAPWTLVEGNDKRHARIKVLRTVCEHLERALGRGAEAAAAPAAECVPAPEPAPVAEPAAEAAVASSARPARRKPRASKA